MMNVAFVRVPELECEAVVTFPGGRVFGVRNPGSIRRLPPHDLGQFVVEHALGWQTGFWGYVARGVVFPGMERKSGARPPHGEERSRAAIRGAKDHLAEVESLAGAIAALVHGNLDDDPDKMRHVLKETWWPPQSKALQLPFDDIRRSCRAFRQTEDDWRALALGGSLQFRWSLRAHALAPANPLDARSRRRVLAHHDS